MYEVFCECHEVAFLLFVKNLLLELKNYEENQKAARLDRPSGLGELDQQQMGIIPVRLTVRERLRPPNIFGYDINVQRFTGKKVSWLWNNLACFKASCAQNLFQNLLQ